jgi:hypothetical protein
MCEALPRRLTDRVEEFVAWVLTAAALLVVVGAFLAGLAVHRSEADRAAAGGGWPSQVRAVLLEDATGIGGAVTVPARWTDRAGLEHTGVVAVPRSAPAGTGVAVWVDAAGSVTAPPLRPANAVFGGVVAALAVLCTGMTGLAATWLGVRGLTGRANARRWERDWTRIEPLWRRTVL